MNFGFWEIMLLIVVILLLFGARKLPELARSIGKSLGEFKKGRTEGETLVSKPDSSDDKKPEEKKET